MSNNNKTETTFAHRLMALTALCGVSTSIGIFMKLSISSGGKFEYSPFSANCLTELYKLMVSLIIVAKLCIESSKTSGRALLDEVKVFFEENLTTKLCWHVFGLTCMYVVVNLSVFGVMVHSTASNFFLMKASSPVITAIILVGAFGRPIHRAQWISIFAQSMGLISTQLDVCRGEAAVSWQGYFFIAINIAVSCVAGVWNEHIIKTMAPSVNAQNVVMYILGVVINFVLFYIPSATSLLGGATTEQPPSFLYGFDNWKVMGVVIANGSVGLVITAVYKYADVVVKTFGIAASVVTLFLLEAIKVLPTNKKNLDRSTGQGGIAFLGATIVFLASYLYIRPKPVEENENVAKNVKKQPQDDQKPEEGTEMNEKSSLKKEEDDDSASSQNTNNKNSTPPASPPVFSSSWTKMEWGLLTMCFFLGFLFMLSRC